MTPDLDAVVATIRHLGRLQPGTPAYTAGWDALRAMICELTPAEQVALDDWLAEQGAEAPVLSGGGEA